MLFGGIGICGETFHAAIGLLGTARLQLHLRTLPLFYVA